MPPCKSKQWPNRSAPVDDGRQIPPIRIQCCEQPASAKVRKNVLLPFYSPTSDCLALPMRFLVTGGSGFIGTNLVRYLLSQSTAEVLNLDRLTYAGQRNSLSDLADHPRYQFVQGDICQRSLVQECLMRFAPDRVIHLAAESHVDRSIDDPTPFMESNVNGTFQLLEAIRVYLAKSTSGDFRMVHVSTDEVFGSLTVGENAFDENHPYDPHSPYAATKAASDHLVQAWHSTYGLPVSIVHTSNNYGPYQYPEKLIPTVIIKALRHEVIPVYGNGSNIRDWLHVADHCRAMEAVATHGAIGTSYNIGASNEHTNLDIVQAVCQILDELTDQPPHEHAKLIAFVEDRPGHDQRYAIDSTRLRRELGWSPQISFAQGLRDTVKWYWTNRPWWEKILTSAQPLQRRGLPTQDRVGSQPS